MQIVHERCAGLDVGNHESCPGPLEALRSTRMCAFSMARPSKSLHLSYSDGAIFGR